MLLVDEDGNECVVAEAKLCGDDGYVITDDDLLACQSETSGEG